MSQVWLSWLDDPSDRKARGIGKDHNNLLLQLAAARDALHAAAAARPRGAGGGALGRWRS